MTPRRLSPEARRGVERAFLDLLRARHPGTRWHVEAERGQQRPAGAAPSARDLDALAAQHDEGALGHGAAATTDEDALERESQ